MNRRSVAFVVIIVVLSVLLAWRVVNSAWQSLRLAFAYDQVMIFEEMANKASKLLARSSPNVHEAAGYLEYIHSYYPSGTKQTPGSLLDRIVETSRRLAELRIVQMMREATGRDLADNAEVWIREYGDARTD